MTEPLPELARLSIGKVLDELRLEFPDLTITKIRYLESEGLIEPERTPSGYRKFSLSDVERLRFILSRQRDAFWPLSHIRQVLDEHDRGIAPDLDHTTGIRVPTIPLGEDGLPEPAAFTEGRSQLRLSREELMEAAQIDSALLTAIEEFGLIERRSSQTYYDGDHLQIASIVGEFSMLGLEPRHLKHFRSTAEREAALFEQVVTPRARQDDKGAAATTVASLAALSVRLHTVLVRNRLRG